MFIHKRSFIKLNPNKEKHCIKNKYNKKQTKKN